MLTFAVFTAFATSFSVLGEETASCNVQAMADCMRSMMRPIPRNTTQLDEFCQQASTALTCVENLECGENDASYEQWQTMMGMAEAANYLCTADAREAYVTCVPGASMDVGSDQTCVSEATAIKETSLSATYCRQNTTLLKCYYELWKSRCSEGSARVYATYYYKYLKRSLAAYNCVFDTSYLVQSAVSDDNGGGVCRMTSSVTSLVMLFIVTLMLSRRQYWLVTAQK